MTSGLRLGTPALTTRGMGAGEMRIIAKLVKRVLEDPQSRKVLAEVRKVVSELCGNFPIYQHLVEDR